MSDIIDINVGETIEEVTINVVDNLITVNINKVTGGGGTQTLAQTLVLGNITDGENISISNGDAIVLDNGSMLKKGTIDAGNGGSKGISQICGVGFEHKWEAGRLYIMNDGGTIIREVSHNLTYTPTATDDVTKGFVQNTRWILDNGDVYLCTDPTEDAAVWELVNTGTTPNLQQVTDAGNETTNAIKAYQLVTQTNGSTKSMTLSSSNVQTERIAEWQDKDYTGIADITDIPDTSTFVPYTGATQNVDLGEYETAFIVLHHVSENEKMSKPNYPAPRKALMGKVAALPELVLSVALDSASNVYRVAVVKNRHGKADPNAEEYITLAAEASKMTLYNSSTELFRARTMSQWK